MPAGKVRTDEAGGKWIDVPLPQAMQDDLARLRTLTKSINRHSRALARDLAEYSELIAQYGISVSFDLGTVDQDGSHSDERIAQ